MLGRTLHVGDAMCQRAITPKALTGKIFLGYPPTMELAGV